MKNKSFLKSGTIFFLIQLPFIVILIVCVLLWRYESDKHQKNLNTMLDKIVSIETDKTLFIQKYRDIVMEINSSINTIDCILMLTSVYDNCKRFDLNPELVLSIIENESLFEKNAKSSAGALGLMQVMPATAKLVAHYIGMIDYDLTNISDNITLGCCYLIILLHYHSETIALAVYNAGGNYEIGLDYANDVLQDKDKWL
ncbi:transglycosylase SLT domain-containing protein [candidate division WOR-3 bacterium]|nr:transglycosylase SLT domain-containing protein [candidate division WOR-3 bacterium]